MMGLTGRVDDGAFGVGPVPPEIKRVNWAAVLLGPVWALLYGIWPWFWILAAVGVAGRLVFWLEPQLTIAGGGLAAPVLAEVTGWTLSGVFGWRANRELWRRVCSGAREPLTPPRTTELYVGSQRIWTRVGAGVVGVGYGLGLWRTLTVGPDHLGLVLLTYFAGGAVLYRRRLPGHQTALRGGLLTALSVPLLTAF